MVDKVVPNISLLKKLGQQNILFFSSAAGKDRVPSALSEGFGWIWMDLDKFGGKGRNTGSFTTFNFVSLSKTCNARL
jgi:hypothetical protein